MVILRCADAVVAVSDLLASTLTKDYRFLNKKEIRVIHNGIDCAWCDPQLPQKISEGEPSREKIPVILNVGGTTYAKGADLLLDAAKDLKCQVRLVGARTPFLLGLRRKHATEFETAKFVHAGPLYAQDLCAAYRTADIFALPSRFDSFPFTVLEAMRHGLPVVISDRVGVKEVIKDGLEGFVVPSSDVRALGRRIHQLLADTTLRRRMGDAARHRANQLTWAKSAATYVDFLREIAASREMSLPAGNELAQLG